MQHIDDNVWISDDEARSAVTGHNVRYVLAFGMLGVVTAFAGIAIYFGFDRLADRVNAALAQGPAALFFDALPLALLIAAAGALAYMLFALWTLISGPSGNATQKGMRARIVMQFAAICAIMMGLYLAAG